SEPVYPGTCRNGMPLGKVPRAIRFRATDDMIAFDDLLCGRTEARADDFIVRRADGVFAYQLAVVVDDAAQEVTQVVRGCDLLSSTPRQIALQRALGYATPDRKSTRLNSSHVEISYAVFCLKKKKHKPIITTGHHLVTQ